MISVKQLSGIFLPLGLVMLSALHKKATIHQVTTMLATSKIVSFPVHNHLLTTSTDDPILIIAIVTEHYNLHNHAYKVAYAAV